MRLVLVLFVLTAFMGTSAYGEGLKNCKESLHGLAWMQGSWTGAETGSQNKSSSRFEESWTDAAGGIMVGMGKEIEKEIEKDKLSFFEYLRIESRKEGLFYVAQPFGKQPVSFKLLRMNESVAVFENKEHDFPHRITYFKKADGVLEIELLGVEDGAKEKRVSYTLKRSR